MNVNATLMNRRAIDVELMIPTVAIISKTDQLGISHIQHNRENANTPKLKEQVILLTLHVGNVDLPSRTVLANVDF